MRCPQCQQENPPQAKFCLECAQPVSTVPVARHLGLGKLYARTDKREQAREHLTTAATMYREMEMRFWLEQGERELRGA